jgi:glycosyltransferase involved in cell wall biosynthesis
MSEPAPEPQIHGVLVTFQRPDELRASLEALDHQTRRLDRLVVVDNSPGREADPVVAGAEVAGHVEYIATGANLGPAGGIAVGMERCLEFAADHDWVCLLDDDDPLPDPRILSDRIGLASSCIEDDVAGFGGRGGVLDRRSGRLRPCEPGGDADYLASGYCPLYRVNVVRSVGVFDPELFFGFDDLDYGMRVKDAGWRLKVVPRTDVGNLPVGPPAWSVGPMEWRRYYSLRNLVYLLRAHGYTGAAVRVSLVNGLGKPIANVPLRPRLAVSHLRMNARAVRDAWLGRLGLTVRPDAARRVGKAA